MTSTADQPALEVQGLSPLAAKGLIRCLRRSRRRQHLVKMVVVYGLLLLVFATASFIGDFLAGVLNVHPHVDDAIAQLLAVFVRAFAIVVAIDRGWAWLMKDERQKLAAFIADTWKDGRPPICYACNYDLSGSNATACPECGEIVPYLREAEPPGSARVDDKSR